MTKTVSPTQAANRNCGFFDVWTEQWLRKYLPVLTCTEFVYQMFILVINKMQILLLTCFWWASTSAYRNVCCNRRLLWLQHLLRFKRFFLYFNFSIFTSMLIVTICRLHYKVQRLVWPFLPC